MDNTTPTITEHAARIASTVRASAGCTVMCGRFAGPDIFTEVKRLAAAADVEADFPDAECGWETDVARSVIMSEVSDGTVTRAVAAEWFRCQFGCRL